MDTSIADAAVPGQNKPHTVTVKVNRQPVVLEDRQVTGLEIKEAAAAQGVPVDSGFQLSIQRPSGRYEVVGDHDQIRVHPGEEFLAVSPDENS
ncbi:multiubiquitin [Streptomyces sp. TLI_235]|nr:multiubiquitin domain-containing protein [Streptomyces sp. TLI_235]PBC69687.1 multiubiquitin [Streptomyces sp. TLI_235]